MEAHCHVGNRVLPTLLNTVCNITDAALASIACGWGDKPC
jgi:hypothetical protein